MGGMPEYSNISIPKELRNEIQKLFDDLEAKGVGLGYRTVPEFIMAAIREKLEKTKTIWLLGVRAE